ncbi:TetR/AcrR family transcriptional regulator [Cohnella abietis]|uniref:TetR/AcrR family transcriptional regulator n=1 Tax=Cohnella abietis TaxID=2507935 RepID=UPI001E58798F|nr:TetR/AcrR family transcriptional regulator [Cohnella abietis]
MRNLRKEQAAETREKLLEAAKTLFAEKGYHATPVRAINRKIDKGDGILYHYFPGGKREILSVLLHESFEYKRNEIKLIHENIGAMTIRDALAAILNRMNELFISDLELIRIMFRENHLLESDETKQLSDFVQGQIHLLAGFLRRSHEKGEIKNLNFKLAARQFLSMGMQGRIGQAVGINLIDDDGDINKYTEDIIDFSLDLWKKP